MRGLTAQVVALVLTVALPCAAVIAYLVYAGADDARRQAAAQARHVADEIARDAEVFMSATRERAAFLAQRPLIRSSHAGLCDPLIVTTHRMNPHYAMIFVVDPRGDVVCWSLEQPSAGVNYADRRWFRDALQATGFRVGAPVAGRATGGTLAVPFTVTVRDAAGAVISILNMPATMREVSRLAEHPRLPAGSVATIVSADGTIIARSLDPGKWLGRDASEAPLIAELRARREGTATLRGLDDVERIYAFTTIPGVEWLVATAVPVDVVMRPYRERVLHTIAMLALITFGVVVLAFVFARRIVRPIHALSHAVRAVSQGSFHASVPVTGPDEIREFARAFNEMRQRRAGAEASLRQRSEQVESANAELEAFAYSVSHDLRTPLRAIDGFSQVLLEDYADKVDAEGQDSLRRIRAASQRLGVLIDDILRLSRAGRAALAASDVDLTALAESTVADLRRADPGRDVQVSIARGITAWGDPGLVRQVLANLLDNAWKFTAKRRDARIEVTAERKGGELVCCVADNGAGFDPAYADRLWGPFQRLHSEQEFPGTGIGLATVKRIVSRHGGRVWAEGNVNQGARFCFALPLDPAKGSA